MITNNTSLKVSNLSQKTTNELNWYFTDWFIFIFLDACEVWNNDPFPNGALEIYGINYNPGHDTNVPVKTKPHCH